MLQAAERTGALLVIASSLYGYGPVDEVMTEDLPDRATEKNGRIRAGMWAEAKAMHEAGRIRAVEVRASDYVGAGVPNGHLPRNVPAALAGKPVSVFGDPDLPHSWTDVLDVARTLAAVAERPDSWGRVWIAPTNPPRSQREALADVLSAANKPMVSMRSVPSVLLGAAGLVNAQMRALHTMRYIFQRPYVVDSRAAETELGLAPTPWSEVVRRTLDQPGVKLADDHRSAAGRR
jgi:nucleoside-diphosphate-sugar epimerase